MGEIIVPMPVFWVLAVLAAVWGVWAGKRIVRWLEG